MDLKDFAKACGCSVFKIADTDYHGGKFGYKYSGVTSNGWSTENVAINHWMACLYDAKTIKAIKLLIKQQTPVFNQPSAVKGDF